MMAHLTALTEVHTRYAHNYGKAFAVPLALKPRTHLTGASHWLVTWAALRHDEDPALFPGGGEDRYRRGGSSECSSHAGGRRVQGGVSRPGLSTPGLPASCSCGIPVSVRPVVSGWAGGCAGLFAVVRGRRADPGWLSDLWRLDGGGACSAVVAHAVVGRRGARAARAYGGAVAQQVGSFVGSCVA